MTALRVFAVDDEPPALKRLALAMAGLPDVTLVAAETSARDAVGRIRDERPDVLLVDIAMPGIDGFGLIERLGHDTPPAVIFVTAFDQHAVSAFEASAVDYLLKPASPERLQAAFARAREAVEARSSRRRIDELLDIIASYRTGEPGGRTEGRSDLWAHRHRGMIRIPVAGLWWLEAEGDYVRAHAETGERLVRGTLTSIGAELDPNLFVRVHRSAIVRNDQISSVRRKATGALVADLRCGDRVPIGRRYAGGIRDLLRRL